VIKFNQNGTGNYVVLVGGEVVFNSTEAKAIEFAVNSGGSARISHDYDLTVTQDARPSIPAPFNIPPFSILWGLDVQKDDKISYRNTTARDGGGEGRVKLDNWGVPEITGPAGYHQVYFSINDGPDLVAFVGHADDKAIEAQFYIPVQENNRSVLKPSSDSNVVFLSDGEDVVAAVRQMRVDFPDYVLLERGGTYKPTESIWPVSGRAGEPSVIGAFGEGERPHINPQHDRDGMRIWSGRHDIAIMGLKLLPTWRDPDHPDFAGFGNHVRPGILGYSGDGGTQHGPFLLEDMEIGYFSDNIDFTGTSTSRIVLRYSDIHHAYSETGHSQGLFSWLNETLVEYTVFDHNGWLKVMDGRTKAEGGAVIHNHSIYLSNGRRSILRHNISARPSSSVCKLAANPKTAEQERLEHLSFEIMQYGNIGIYGETGWGGGGNNDFGESTRFDKIHAFDNLNYMQGQLQQTDRTLGWGDAAIDWNDSFSAGGIYVRSDNPEVRNIYGLHIKGHQSRNVYSRNRFYGESDGKAIVDQGNGTYQLIDNTEDPEKVVRIEAFMSSMGEPDTSVENFIQLSREFKPGFDAPHLMAFMKRQ